MIEIARRVRRLIADPDRLLLRWPRFCPACGQKAQQLEWNVIVPELARDWDLDEIQTKQMDLREGRLCANCRSSLRSRQLASVLTSALDARTGAKSRSLAEAVTAPSIADLSVAEINSAGSLHPFLACIPRLSYSEYGSKAPNARSEDLHNLSYPDSSFDFVITSDTLEHVPDVERALAETLRVLKPGGQHIFTVPVIWGRPSRRRAEVRDDAVRHHLPPSFHGLYSDRQDDLIVFHEFGDDFVGLVKAAGFDVDLVRDRANPTLCVFVATRPDR